MMLSSTPPGPPGRSRRTGAALCLAGLLSALPSLAPAHADPPPEVQYRLVRPEEGGLRRGLVATPSWVVWLAAGTGVTATLVYLTRLSMRGRSRRP